jgi:hypothetical protein
MGATLHLLAGIVKPFRKALDNQPSIGAQSIPMKRRESYASQKARWAKKRAEMQERRKLGDTLEEIGASFGISRQRVGQIIKNGRVTQ